MNITLLFNNFSNGYTSAIRQTGGNLDMTDCLITQISSTSFYSSNAFSNNVVTVFDQQIERLFISQTSLQAITTASGNIFNFLANNRISLLHFGIDGIQHTNTSNVLESNNFTHLG